METENTTIHNSEFSVKKLPSKEQTPLQQMEDEFKPRQIPILKPLHPITSTKIDSKDPKKTITIDKTKDLGDEFDYLSKTRNLETDTPRTKILQENILDKMTKDTDIQTRVVIMNKGTVENAFVTQDGTVLITQSLINKLDSLDEISAVLAHELGHLIFKTHSRTDMATGTERSGVSWSHEKASDAGTRQLMEKAGYNSFAFSTAIKKIPKDASERGVYHQTGNMRSADSTGEHRITDSRTSDVDLTPIPSILKKEVKKTNLEIINGIIKKEPNDPIRKAKESYTEDWGKEFTAALELLDKREFEKIYDSHNNSDGDKNHAQLLNNCENLIMDRLQKNGFSKTDSLLFSVNNSSISSRQGNLIKTVEEFNSVVDSLENFKNTDKFQQMYKAIFDQDLKKEERVPVLNLISSLIDHLYDVDFEKRQNGIPVTQEALINATDKINKISKPISGRDKSEINTTTILAKYIYKTYLAQATNNKETVGISELKTFFEKFKTRGIELDAAHFNQYLSIVSSVEYNDKKLRISDENKNIAKQAFNEVFETQEEKPVEKKIGFKEIDDFFQELTEHNDGIAVQKFTRNTREYFDNKGFTDQQRLPCLQYINQKIDSSTFKNDRSLLKYLDGGNSDSQTKPTPEEEVSNNLISRFNLKTIMAIGLFEKTGPEFYSSLEQAMNNSGLDPNQLSQTQLINLCQGIFALDKNTLDNSWRKGDKIELSWFGPTINTIPIDYPVWLHNCDSLSGLPFITKITEKDQNLRFTNIHDLNTHIDSQQQKIHMAGSSGLFEENLMSLITGKAARTNFYQLLEAGVSRNDSPEFYNFIKKYYPYGGQKDHFLKEMSKLYLTSPDLSLDEKTDYLDQHFGELNYEGMDIITNEIKHLDKFEIFKNKLGEKGEKYLEGSGDISSIAFVDNLSSKLAQDFDKLFQTASADPKTENRISTEQAKEWFSWIFRQKAYDRKKEELLLGSNDRSSFRTFKDLASTLKNLTPAQKFNTARNALIDGALTTPENRKILGKRLVESLGLKNGFVSEVMKAACQEGETEYIDIPIASILGPLLFRAIDVNAVSLKEVSEIDLPFLKEPGDSKLKTVLSNNEISKILQADTRNIAVFGHKYTNPDSAPAQLWQLSDLKYRQITDSLNTAFNKNQNEQEQSSQKTEIDPTTEAVIKGVENSGALGIRALQLATQFQKFEPALEKRLSESLDSQPGLEKKRFWLNLQKLSEEDPSIKSFLEKITLHDYLGGGSLQTTYGATYKDDAGNEKEIILKLKNPNVAAFIKENYNTAHKALEVVSNKMLAGKSGENAKNGMSLIDLAQEWCLADVNDTNFIKHDDLFRQTISKYNFQTGSNQFYAPERIFTHDKLKSEDLAPGRTINKLLIDSDVKPETKKEVVEMLSKFFVYQFRGNSFMQEDGKKYFLVHSDPHVGNYIADISGEKPKIGVIDRSLYLKLEEKDVNVLEKLMVKGNTTEFANSFIKRILDINKVKGDITRGLIYGKIFAKLGAEIAYQKFIGEDNKLALMRTMLTEFSNSNMDVPLNLRLMIRNIGAFQELTKKYGVDMEQTTHNLSS